jgi:benzodiazapine receptor
MTTDVTAARPARVGALLLFAGATAAAAAFGSRFPPGDWYATLPKPSWTPPSWIFGAAWTLLYALIAAAGWIAWRRATTPRGKRLVIAAWSVQMALNAAWSWLFFGLHAQALAMADLIALFFAIVVCIVLFRRIAPLAALLFVPYAIWVSFAGLLQAAILALQRGP